MTQIKTETTKHVADNDVACHLDNEVDSRFIH
jgi:hypothetical protein